MKKVLLAAAGMVFAMQAQAFHFNPVIGIDGAYSNFEFKENFGDPIYDDRSGVVAPYIGTSVWGPFGVELGYMYFPNEEQTVRLNPGQRVQSGIPTSIAAGSFFDVVSERKMQAPYLAATGKYSFPQCPQLSVSIALGGAVAKLEAQERVIASNLGPLTAAQTQATLRTFNDSKLVFLGRIGAEYMLNDFFGVRAFGAYMNTGALKILSEQFPALGAQAEINMKDSVLVGGGVFVTNFM